MVVALASPLHVGVYRHGNLIEQHQSMEHTSDALPVILKTFLDGYTIERLLFARGPGSFMSIKISYIFLKTLSITLGIPLLASDGFAFNEGRPIKALAQRYFVKEGSTITTRQYDEAIEQHFALPMLLDETHFSEQSEPLYMLPAV